MTANYQIQFTIFVHFKRINLFRSITCILCFFLASCSLSDFSSTMSIDQMKIIMWDMMKADELNNIQSLRDSGFAARKMNFAYYEQVFRLHDINREEFYRSMKYYESHPPLMKILIDSLDQYAARERNKIFQSDVPYKNGNPVPPAPPR
ncbi:MAG: DUF4296 domain-containing protein [Sediminibacterium sp.]